ncbi:hypothetical protein NEMIN01_1694 [Nematocida minor]|uniref:uncharacterized protein n=1 Tax=Nematocida minor TaxID=1912983 RepID=UPI0022201137|nr:uncharacterized protein NEMIN01_1694 [Nematocida minor]KAI5191839.1 hypothetical protein NEMIN01_1694 [Nematocida minor]
MRQYTTRLKMQITEMARTERLEKEKQELTPIFASHEDKMDFYPEHNLIKIRAIELVCLWNNYIGVYNEMDRSTGSTEVLSVSIRDLALRIHARVKELGEVLFYLLEELEDIDFHGKYKDFERTQENLCQTACSILYINKKSLTADLLDILNVVEYSLYKCLTMGQKIAKKKVALEEHWVRPKQYSILKYLYKNCNYNLREYLLVHRLTTRSIAEQKSLLFEVSIAQQLYGDFLMNMKNQFMPSNLMDTHSGIYAGLSVDGKIQHHETSIGQRRSTIDQIIKYHKKIINEIDVINWCVGKEAKNIINMEKTMHGKCDLSMKKLFSLFESSSNRLKEYEVTLSRYAKLVTSSKRSESTVNRLFQIKSLDFNYLIIEGNLKSLKEDVHLLYSASKEIYNRRNEAFKGGRNA